MANEKQEKGLETSVKADASIDVSVENSNSLTFDFFTPSPGQSYPAHVYTHTSSDALPQQHKPGQLNMHTSAPPSSFGGPNSTKSSDADLTLTPTPTAGPGTVFSSWDVAWVERTAKQSKKLIDSRRCSISIVLVDWPEQSC